MFKTNTLDDVVIAGFGTECQCLIIHFAQEKGIKNSVQTDRGGIFYRQMGRVCEKSNSGVLSRLKFPENLAYARCPAYLNAFWGQMMCVQSDTYRVDRSGKTATLC